MISKVRSKLSYANVVATLALFVAVGGGTAFAVVAANQVNSASIVNGQVKTPDLGTHAVTKSKIASGAVTNSRIAANAVNGSRVLNNSLTGADINEASLGTVPNATHATSADNASNLGGVGPSGYLSAGTVRRFGPVVVNDQSQPVVLLSSPPFTLKAAHHLNIGTLETGCSINFNNNNTDTASATLESSEDHWAWNAVLGLSPPLGIGKGDEVGAGNLGQASTTTGTPSIVHATGDAATPSGKQIWFSVYEGVNILGHPGKCVYGGVVVLN